MHLGLSKNFAIFKPLSRAQQVLFTCAAHLLVSLADMYNRLTMTLSYNLLNKYNALDKVINAVYNYLNAVNNSARVAFLFECCQQLTSFLTALKKTVKLRKTK